MNTSFRKLSLALKRLWQVVLLELAGEKDLLATLDMQRQIIAELQEAKQVEMAGYKLTLDYEPEEGTMGFHILCYHPLSQREDGPAYDLSRYFHAMAVRTTRSYMSDLNARFKELLEIERADLMRGAVKYEEPVHVTEETE